MEIESTVLEQIGAALESGSFDPKKSACDQANVFLTYGVCGLDLLDALMAIETAIHDAKHDFGVRISNAYEQWTVEAIRISWLPILATLGYQEQKK